MWDALESALDDLKQAMDHDDAPQIETLLRTHSKWPDRIYLFVDRVYDGLRGRTLLHRFRRCVERI